MEKPTEALKRKRDRKDAERTTSKQTEKNFNLASVPQGIINKLVNAKIIGYQRPSSEQIMDTRVYTIHLKTLRDAMTLLLKQVLNKCLHDKGNLIEADLSTIVSKAVPLTVDACMTTLYAKMRTIHEHNVHYSGRFTAATLYNKDIELPLPFADAISDFGVFESTCAKKCFVFVPVFPEGTKHEGRSVEEWDLHEYERCLEIFKEVGIPCRSVDTHLKSGSAWWTYRTAWEYGMYSGAMIVPKLHYSDYSATVASMFLMTDEAGKIRPLIEAKADDEDYGEKFCLLRPGVQVRAFMASIFKPEEEWSIGFTFK